MNSNIISISSMIIAIGSFILSIYQVISLKRHNIFSVRPFLSFNGHVELNKKIMRHVCNGGLGPAVLKSIDVIFNDEKHRFTESFMDDFLSGYKGIRFSQYFISSDDILNVNEEKELLKIEVIDQNETLPIELISKVKALRFLVKFESLYGVITEKQSDAMP